MSLGAQKIIDQYERIAHVTCRKKCIEPVLVLNKYVDIFTRVWIIVLNRIV